MEDLWKIITLIALFAVVPRWLWSQKTKTKLALLNCRENDGQPTTPVFLSSLIKFCNDNLGTDLAKEPVPIEADSQKIFNYSYVYLSGPDHIVFTETEIQNLREYLSDGGFLHTTGNYVQEATFRQEMKKIFPEDEFVELPPEHPIFHRKYNFPQDLHKDEKYPQALGIVKDERLAVLFTYTSGWGDGTENTETRHEYNSSQLQALQMGANIISYLDESL